MFNPKDSGTIDTTAHDDLGMQYPIIQWTNGNPQMQQSGGIAWTGGWFANGEDHDLEGDDSWSPYELFFRDQSSSEGWAATVLPLSIIRKRQRWEAYAESGPRKVWAWNQYEQATNEGYRPRARTHLLCMVRGQDEPVVVTLPGTIGRYVMDEQRKFRRTVLAAANKASKEAGSPPNWQPWHFWMPLGAPLVQKVPKFTTVGSGNAKSQITTPVLWGVPTHMKDISSDLLGKLYIGADSINAFDTLWHESQTWQEEWESQALIQAQENKFMKEKLDDEAIDLADVDEIDPSPVMNPVMEEVDETDIPW